MIFSLNKVFSSKIMKHDNKDGILYCYHHSVKNIRTGLYHKSHRRILIIMFRSRMKTLRNVFCLEYWSFMSSSNVDRIVNFYTFQIFILIPRPYNKRNCFQGNLVCFVGSITLIIYKVKNIYIFVNFVEILFIWVRRLFAKN